MINKIKIGSRWSSIDRTFKVIGLEQRDGEDWVFFVNENTKDEFSCLVGAFIARYSQILNDQR